MWCCKSFVEDAKAVNTMFEVLRLCNRSEPHRKLISVTLATLLNISRDAVFCAPLMADAARVGTIAFTAERYKEYNGIFSQACALLCGASRVAAIRTVRASTPRRAALQPPSAPHMRWHSHTAPRAPAVPVPTTHSPQAMKADRDVMKRVKDCSRLFTTKWKREQAQVARGTRVKKSVEPSYNAITMLAAALDG